MKVLNFLLAILFASFVIMWLGTYIPLPNNAYSNTANLANETLKNVSNDITQYTNTSTDSDGIQQILDYLGMLQVSILGTFHIFTKLPDLFKYFVIDTLSLLGISISDPLVAFLISMIGFIATIYLTLMVIEWVRPGFIKSI